MAWYRMTGSGELHGAVISGTTSESTLIGQTVNLTKNGEIIQTDIIASDGTFSFIDIQDKGTYIVSATDTNNIPVEYSVSITSNHIVNKTVLSISLILRYVTILGTTEESTLFGKTVNLYSNNTLIKSSLINSSGSFNFIVTTSGDYVIKASNGSDEASIDITISSNDIQNKVNIDAELSFIKIVTFANGTDEQIAAMVNAHYAGKINIADYWSVGDERTIHINAMSATGVSESHHADDYKFVIIGINHDNLTTSVNGKTKAAITLQTKRILFKDTTTTSYNFNWNALEECGYMNSSNTNLGGWSNCVRRTWCNNVFFNALPSWLQALIKPVNKLTSDGNQSTTIKTTSDKAFLLSEIEIFGSIAYSYAGEGSQYQYFKTTSNRYKLPAYSEHSSVVWWERSPYSGNSASFCNVSIDGSATINDASYCNGLAPAICL